ncbi:MAG: tRNA (guanine(26)-N(2))-dimethyltransferase [archaeon]
MLTTKTREGTTGLIVPDISHYGKSSQFPPSEAPVFYNPVMEFSRTVSVCFLKGVGAKGSLCDALAASGARGLRYANEVGGLRLTFFDRNPQAVALIKRNLRSLKIKAEVQRGDTNSLLSGRHWDIVDIDPFGTPVPFLDSCARASEKVGMVTATDTANLCGVYPKACLRLYGCKPFRSDFVHEAGVRILLGKIASTYAQHEKAVYPILTQSSQHYFRAFFDIRRGAKRADDTLKNIGYILYCPKCLSREVSLVPDKKCPCGKRYLAYGPLWARELFNQPMCKKMIAPAKAYGKQYEQFFATVAEEAGINCPYYNYHKLNSKMTSSPPKFDLFLDALRKKGYAAAKSHMDKEPTFRTDAPVKRIKVVLKSLS